MKQTILKNAAFLLCFIILFLSLTGCAEKLPEEVLQSQSHYENRVKGIKMSQVTCWDNYIVHNIDFGGVYNRSTGEMQVSFCEDPECDGLCFLEQGPLYVYHVADGQIYFIVREKNKTHYCRKDIITGDVHVYFTLNDKEVIATRDMYMDESNLYYPKKCLIEGGNPDDPNDYQLYIYRMDADGSNNEMVYKMRDNTEFLWFVDNGILYTQWQMKLYQIDLATMECREFFDIWKEGFTGISEAQYIDGKFYFSYCAQDWWIAAPNGQTLPSMKIVCVDVESGEWKYLLDVGVATYCITNDKIYFVPFEITQWNDPSVYAPNGENAKYSSSAPRLYMCDLNGESIRLVWEEEKKTILLQEYTVVDQVLYGWVSFFDEEKNQNDPRQFVEIKLETGDIIPATVLH